MKIVARIIGFLVICLGIFALAFQTYPLGMHPVALFILGVLLLIYPTSRKTKE